MTNDDDTKFVLSTGNIAAAIRDLPKRSTTAADVASIWLDVLGVFFPDDQGFQRTRTMSTDDRVLIQVQRNRDLDLDGDVIVDDDQKSWKSILLVDCRGNAADNSNLQFGSAEVECLDDFSFKFGVVSFGAQVIFLKGVSYVQEAWSLHGVNMGCSNLIKATGRDTTEDWLRKIKDICDR